MAPVATADLVDTLPSEPTTLYYYLELKDGGIVQTYPGTAFEKRRKHVPHAVNVSNLRSVKDKFTLEKNGFQLVENVSREKDFLDNESVRTNFYPQCEALIKELSGADHVHVISHMSRRHRFDEAQQDAAAKGDREFVTKNNPARFVHCDQSYRGAEQVLYLNLAEEEAERRRKKRWAIMNVWQPIQRPVRRDPLAFLDYTTLDETDFRPVVANLPPPGAGEYGNVSKNLAHTRRTVAADDAGSSADGDHGARYEVTNMAHNPGQRWYYASDMTPDEAWVFKIFDSKKDGRARCAVHSSFPLKDQVDPDEPRMSVEVRCFAFWDDEDAE